MHILGQNLTMSRSKGGGGFSFLKDHMTHSQMLGKVESGGGPIFKVVLEC